MGKRIYLAGKVYKNCWRHDVVDGLRSAYVQGDGMKGWPMLPGAVMEEGYLGKMLSIIAHKIDIGEA